ncbi:MAG: NADH-quinone oxidoreductase subunit L [Pseudomonadota bacterium]|nr:NADH-quinone oxidoreductase subunit L [Pseudomonadota bacterium]
MKLYQLLVLMPLLGALTNGLLLRRASNRTVHIVGVLPILVSFVLALIVYTNVAGSAPVTVKLFDWLQVGEFNAPLALYFDRLSLLMLLIVTGIGTVIHVFAGGYMHAERHLHRFFCYLNLFIFMMLLLILSANMLVMFIGWEGVGLCSYLLIGYWFSDANNAKAGMKAFVVNRIGDMGFLLAIFLTFKLFATVSFVELKELLANTETVPPELYWITLCMFIGACGKSAQLPLHVWLPDAMAGPTPVSALIHAATMVTAGVFMMTRLHFMYELTPAVMNIVAVVGAITALFAATIAITQRDIKKVLAYSTVSQLGYMVMACGVGAFGAGVFHLLTHACFKALLFLGAGSVIVALHHQQDMFKMGGLFKSMRITGTCMLIGVLAIIGFPGLAGFFSKDEVLFLTFTQGNTVLWAMGIATAFFTAFYMVRMFCLTFMGTARHEGKVHETGAVMWLPLTLLALLSITVGYLGVPHALGGHNLLHQYLAPVLGGGSAEHDVGLEISLMLVSVAVMAAGALLAFLLYRRGLPVLPRLPLYSLSLNKYWLDELYDKVVVIPCAYLAQFTHKIIDEGTIDAIVNGLGRGAMKIASASSSAMTGSLHRYALYILLGLVGAVFMLV